MTDEVQLHQTNKDHAVKLTDAAIDHVRKQIAKQGAGIGIRLSIKTTGCSGLSYVVDILQQTTEHDSVYAVDDQLLVAIDRKDLPMLKGTTIDFVKQGLNHQFTYSNPNATGSCGCGESFTIE